MTPRERYEKWIMSLPLEERRKARRLGVEKYHDDGGVVFSPDVSDVPEQADTAHDTDAVEIRDYMRELVRSGKTQALLSVLDELGLQNGQAETIRPALDLILKAKGGEARLEAECVALALGLFTHEGITYADIGRRWQRSRQVIQVRIKNACRVLGIETTERSKSVASREVYRLRNHRHAKKTLATKTQQPAAVLPFEAQPAPTNAAA